MKSSALGCEATGKGPQPMTEFALGSYILSAIIFVLFALAAILSERFRERKNEKLVEQIDFAALILFFLLILSLAASIASLILTHQELIFAVLSNYWSIPPAILAGPILYLFRSRQPFAYGICEVVASWAIILVAIKGSGATTEGLALLPKATGILGGIYVTVRGLDNMDKKIPAKFRCPWKSFFHGKRTALSTQNTTT
jgi:hypothetical protein